MMNPCPRVSILMPSLNVAGFIRECMDSVVNQTLKDIEIICIDAGSTDGTLEILHEYEKLDQRIHVIVSDKKSYGYQMNLGLDAANGEYIGIVETDDWVEPDMFENLWNAAKQNNVDIVKSNYFWYYTNPEIVNKPFENLAKCPYDQVFSPQAVFTPFTVTPSIWSGIYRRSFLTDNNIRFNETPGASYQDTSFHFMVFTVAQSAYFLNKYYLHYRRDNEASSVNTGEKVYCIADEMHYYENFLETHPEARASHIKPYMALKYEKYRWNYVRLDPQFQWDFLTVVRQEFLSHKKEGLLEENRFDANAWKNVNEIMNNPVRYFKNTCKKYSTRPVGKKLPQAEMLKQSLVEYPDVSIIIPSYNNQDCIHRSLESAQKQTLKNIEIICVDDGSDDETVKLIMESAIMDSRITVLHQVNQGLSSARNAGLQVAKGRYIQFLDSDDSLREDAAATLVSFADTKELEILYFDGNSVYETKGLKEKYSYYVHAYEYETNQQKVLSGKEYFCSAIEDGKFRVNVCMALFNRQFLGVNHIRFIDGILHEDHAFSYFTVLTAKRVWHITEKLYFRYVRSNSTMTAPKSFFHVYGILTCYQAMFQIIQSLSYDERLYSNAAKELNHICALLRSSYNMVKDKKACREKLTDTELLLLEQILKPVQNTNNTSKNKEIIEPLKKPVQNTNNTLKSKEAMELLKLRNELLKLRTSNSYKIGRFITWPIRTIKEVINSFKMEPNWENRAPKVLFVSSDAYRMSGAFLSEIVLNRILNQKFNIKTHVILPYRGSGQKLIDEAKVSNHVITSHDWIVPIETCNDFRFFVKKHAEHTENLRAAIEIARYALINQFNIIHSNTTYTYVGYIASRLSGIPHVWHLREFLEEGQNKKIYCQKQGYKMIGNSQRVITISDALYKKFKTIVPKPNLKCIYNGISADKYYSPQKAIFKKDVPVFLFLSGSDSPNKGREDLIKACERLNNEGVRFELWFVGWCGLEIQKLVRKAGLADKTRFFGYQQNTEVYYGFADIFFMCSHFEGFGRTTVEAMLNGCLVIGADSAGTNELIDDLKTGLLYPYGNIDRLVEVIKFAMANKEKMCDIANEGRKFMFNNMTSEINAQRILDVYKEITTSYQPLTKFRTCLKYGRIELTYFQFFLRKYIIDKVLQKTAELLPEKKIQDESVCMDNISTVPKVSIIVPVYNVKDYLHQCLESICNQTLKEIEIICVNDGSTDGSEEIINEYAKKDKRIIVINKENSGYGASVNRGLEIATGEYIAIVETDDFIDTKMYENLYNLAIERGSVDIIKSSYWLYYDTEDGKGTKKEAPIKSACHPQIAVFNVWEYPEIIYHHPSIWSCLYKREFLNSNHIRFVEAKGAGWVDNPFLIETFCKAKRITWTPDAYYYYRQTNPNASSFLKDCSIPFQRTAEMIAFLDKENILDKEIRGSVYKRILWNTASTLDNPYYVPDKDDPLIRSQLQHVDIDFLNNKYVRDVERNAYRSFNKYKTARIDIKNYGAEGNLVEVIETSDKSATVQSPGWFKTAQGQGIVIHSFKGDIRVVIKCSGNGALEVALRGVDCRDKNNKRIPVWIDFKKLNVNGEDVFTNSHVVWHDKPFKHRLNVVDGEIVSLEVEWKAVDNTSEHE